MKDNPELTATLPEEDNAVTVDELINRIKERLDQQEQGEKKQVSKE